MKKIFITAVLLLFLCSNLYGATKLEDEGVNKGYINILDFVGAGVTATRSGIKGTITIPGGGGGTGDITDVGDVTTGAAFTSGGNGSILYFQGTASGQITLTTPAAAGTNTITWPASTGIVLLKEQIDTEAEFDALLFDVLTSELDPLALKTADTDNVKETHIDWGSGAGQVNTDDIPEGSSNLYQLTQEEVDDYIDALINDPDSVHTRIVITYDDIDNAMDFVVDADLHNYSWTNVDATDLKVDSITQAYDADLDALAGLASNGLIARTGAGTASVRTIMGTANEIIVTNGDGIAGNPVLSLDSDIKEVAIHFTIDGGGSVITTGAKIWIRVPFAMIITGWDITAKQSGSCVIDVWKDTYTNFPPTVADTIAGSEKPTLSASQKNQDTSLTTWTTSVAKGDYIRINVDSASTVTIVYLTIYGTKG